MIHINGVAHTNITVSNWEVCRDFYAKLLPFFGMEQVFDGADFVYFVGGRTAMAIGRCDPQFEGQRFVQNAVGLHHHCWRARSREDVDKVYAHLLDIEAKIVHPPEEGGWAPGYYSVLFEDPVGTRLEVNHVPGQGVLAEGVSFDPSGDYEPKV
jgi:catechol 2,3-dioxygenase-like lactoylglutathione lyase family enzyme